MRNFLIVLLAISMIIGLGFSAACASPYLAANYGAVWLDETDFNSDSDDAEISHDQGYVYTVAVGYQYLKDKRIELEYSNRKNDADEIDGDSGSTSINGDTTTSTFMINGFYDFFPGEKLTPFFGGGIGVANVELDADDIGTDKDDVFAYQLSLGLACEIFRNTKIDVQYRYFATEKPDYTFNGVNVESDYSTHNLMVGLRYNF